MRISSLPFKVGDKVRMLDKHGEFVNIGEIRDIDVFVLIDRMTFRYVVFKFNNEYGGMFTESALQLLELSTETQVIKE